MKYKEVLGARMGPLADMVLAGLEIAYLAPDLLSPNRVGREFRPS